MLLHFSLSLSFCFPLHPIASYVFKHIYPLQMYGFQWRKHEKRYISFNLETSSPRLQAIYYWLFFFHSWMWTCTRYGFHVRTFATFDHPSVVHLHSLSSLKNVTVRNTMRTACNKSTSVSVLYHQVILFLDVDGSISLSRTITILVRLREML